MATVITNTVVDEFVWNKLYIRIYDLTLAVYATNGYTAALGFSPIAYRLKRILGINQIGCDAAADLIVQVRFDFTNNKLLAFKGGTFTPAGTISAPTFTGDALAAHRHVLHFQTSAAANAVTAAANALRTAAAAFDVAGVANSSGEGGVVDASAGTPTGTNSAPTFTGTAQGQQSFAEVSNAVDLSAVKVRCMIFGR